ncbi:MAG: (Fe-S)-binding protein, partial [Vampirovibrionales bacterium]
MSDTPLSEQAQSHIPPCTAPHVSDETLTSLASACVHCGMCLSSCPTYLATGNEGQSPRGRIRQVEALIANRLTLEEVQPNLESCLQCLGCQTACPSGVQYGSLIDVVLKRLHAQRPKSRHRLAQALVFTMTHPVWLWWAGLAGWVYRRLQLGILLRAVGVIQRLPKALQVMEGQLPQQVPPPWATLTKGQTFLPTPQPPHKQPSEQPPLPVWLLTGCAMHQFQPHVHRATLKVLTAVGATVTLPTVACCGALAWHVQDVRLAQAQGQALLQAWQEAGKPAVLLNSAGCGAHLKHLASVFEPVVEDVFESTVEGVTQDSMWHALATEFSHHCHDVHEWLLPYAARLAERFNQNHTEHPVQHITYQPACHLHHAQKI